MKVKWTLLLKFSWPSGSGWRSQILWDWSFWNTPPLVFPQIAKNWISRKSKTTKVCFRTFPDLWRHPYTELFCLIWNLTYRTNETFFSRRLSFGSPFHTWFGSCVINVLKMIMTMLRIRILVWLTDVPLGVVFAHNVQQSATLYPRRRDFICKRCINVGFLNVWILNVWVTKFIIYRFHSLSHVPPWISSAWLSFLACQLLKLLPTFATYFKKLNYPTAHPVFISPATFNLMSNQSRQKNSFLVFD